MKYFSTKMISVMLACMLSAPCLLMLMAGGAMAIEVDIDVSNTSIEDITVFQQNYSSLYHVPNNMVIVNEINPFTVKNISMTYDYLNNAIDINATNGRLGKLIISGAYPAMVTNYSLYFTMERSHQNSVVNLNLGNAYIAVKQVYIVDGSILGQKIQFTSYYYIEGNVTQQSSSYLDVLENNRNGHVNMSVFQDNINNTNTIYHNGIPILTTPTWKSALNPSVYKTFANPSIIIYPANPEAGGYIDIKLHSISQTVPGYSLITPISDPRAMSFGLDGPHAYDTIDNGLFSMRNLNFSGTIWFDFSDIDSYSSENFTKIKSLLANGWELGIHFSGRLTDKTTEDAIAQMNAEYSQAIELFGQPPTSFCSFQNADNRTHANYAYANLNLIWRNGFNGIDTLSNIGNLMDTMWVSFWEPISLAGAVFPTFTHELDIEPPIPYSIGYSNFSSFINNYQNNSVSLVSWYDYWTLAQNTYYSQLSNFELINNEYFSFTLDNIGGLSRLLINAPFAEIILDDQGNNVPFEISGENIIIEITEGDYQIMTKAHYREMQMNESYSPIYTMFGYIAVLVMITALNIFAVKSHNGLLSLFALMGLIVSMSLVWPDTPLTTALLLVTVLGNLAITIKTLT